MRVSALPVRAAAGLTALLGVAYALMFAGAVSARAGLVVVPGLVLCLTEPLLRARAGDRVLRILSTVSAGITWRVFIRQVLVLVLLFGLGVLSPRALGAVTAAVLGQHLVLGVFSGLRALLRARGLRRLETRNLDVPGADLPAPPPSWLIDDGMVILLSTDIVLVLAVGWGWLSGHWGAVVPAALVMVTVSAVVAASLVPFVLRLLRLPADELRLARAHEAVEALAPLVLLYFSGGLTSIYQVNMWLETMERLERPVLVLLRERRYMGQLAPTTAPVLCLPFSADLMNFPMPSARVGLYVANVGRNIHLLREPALKSAFIGHGDSDKTASFNPATKVYDEVWVAGEAGRQRYVRAQVGVRTEEIVLVGRPQLGAITEQGPPRPADAPFRILYAPTWEGWIDDPHQTSLLTFGVDLVQALLAMPGVHLVYKPHPLTGTVNRAAGAASARIAKLIAAAGAPHTAVLAGERALYDLFNDSDALVTDVSSVVSDYLRSGKPYFVCNPAGLGDAEFRDHNLSAGAAYLVGPQLAGLADGVRAARGADPMRERRRQVRTHLIGDPDVDAMVLFRRAVDDLAARADRQLAAVRRAAEREDVDLGELLGAAPPASPSPSPSLPTSTNAAGGR